MKEGIYVVYHNREYCKFNGEIDNKQNILLLSHNIVDLENGFKMSYSEEYMKKRGFFTCEKEVPKSEITEAYKIETKAIYKGIKCDIWGGKDGYLQIGIYSPQGEEKAEFEKKMALYDFGVITVEQYGTKVFGKYVKPDDPELILEEIRTPIDLDKL